MNAPLIIIGTLWMATAVLFAWWRLQNSAGESMPNWLRSLITAALGSGLWGATLMAQTASGGAVGGMKQLFALIAYILGLGAVFTLWHHSILGFLANPITSAFDGGSEPIIAKPFYSRALAYRKRGEYDAALQEVQVQLQRFPGDLPGWLLWAEIQSDDLHEPSAALDTIRTFLAREKVTPEQRIEALHREADLLLFKMQDRAAAQVVLERLVTEFPNSEAGRLAAQRLSHLPSAIHLAESQSRERPLLTVVHHEERLGLTGDLGASQLEDSRDYAAEMQELVMHLVDHPDDWEQRERLAQLYAEHLGRPDLAHDQLERLVVTPGQPDRQVVRWLNQIADLHLKDPNGLGAARLALDRIISRFPESAAAKVAETRLTHVTYEQRGQKETPKLKLGHYEERIGLKSGHRFPPLRANLPDLAPDPEQTPDRERTADPGPPA